MKIVDITLGEAGGSPAREGWVIVGYSAQGGGRTEMGVHIRRSRASIINADGVAENIVGPFPKWERVALELDANMGMPEWPDWIRHKANGNRVRLQCPDNLDGAVFHSEFRPTGEHDGPREPSPAFIVIADEQF